MALQSVSFSCNKGEITSLLGPNGAGKTTLIKIIAGLVIPDKGTITMNVAKNKIGLATPNDRSFYWRLTGRQNLDFFATLYGLKAKERKQTVEQLLTEVELENDADKPFGSYSAGMKQKLMLARALLNNPAVLLLDEPTSHIDPLTKNNIHALIKNRFIKERGASVLLCTHDLSEAEELSEQIVLLDKGKVLESGSITSIRKKLNPAICLEIAFKKLPAGGWHKGLRLLSLKEENNLLAISLENEIEIPKILRAFVLQGGELVQAQLKQDSLMELFSKITAEVKN